MAPRRLAAVVKAVPGALMLGVGSVFQPKVDPTEHWSSTPKIVLVEEARHADGGDPPSGPRT